MAGTKITRLGYEGYGVKRAGSFSGKTPGTPFARVAGGSYRLVLPPAPAGYLQPNEQTTRENIRRADLENFKKGQDLRVGSRGETLYLLQPNGTPVALTINDLGQWVTPSLGGAGSGDVIGPAGATDNAVARFDGATGKLLQNSGVTIDDSGNLTANNISGSIAARMFMLMGA